MENEIISCIYSESQRYKVMLNSAEYNIEYLRGVRKKLEEKMITIGREYSLQMSIKEIAIRQHHLLRILTCGIYTILFRNKYLNEIDKVEENIAKCIFEYRENNNQNQENDIKLVSSLYSYYNSLEYSKKLQNFLEFLDLLSDEEKKKYLNYKMGDK